jgi:hypothetical protein
VSVPTIYNFHFLTTSISNNAPLCFILQQIISWVNKSSVHIVLVVLVLACRIQKSAIVWIAASCQSEPKDVHPHYHSGRMPVSVSPHLLHVGRCNCSRTDRMDQRTTAGCAPVVRTGRPAREVVLRSRSGPRWSCNLRRSVPWNQPGDPFPLSPTALWLRCQGGAWISRRIPGP